MTTTTCARPECSNPLPPLAIAHDDEFCSSRCCRIAHGLQEDGKQQSYAHAQNRCKGCGRLTSDDEFTRGCISCKKRKAYRKAKGRLAA